MVKLIALLAPSCWIARAPSIVRRRRGRTGWEGNDKEISSPEVSPTRVHGQEVLNPIMCDQAPRASRRERREEKWIEKHAWCASAYQCHIYTFLHPSTVIFRSGTTNPSFIKLPASSMSSDRPASRPQEIGKTWNFQRIVFENTVCICQQLPASYFVIFFFYFSGVISGMFVLWKWIWSEKSSLGLSSGTCEAIRFPGRKEWKTPLGISSSSTRKTSSSGVARNQSVVWCLVIFVYNEDNFKGRSK